MATADLEAAFDDCNLTLPSAAIASECLALCMEHDVAPEDLAIQLESFVLSRRQKDKAVSPELLGAFRAHLASEAAKARVRAGGTHLYTRTLDLDDDAELPDSRAREAVFSRTPAAKTPGPAHASLLSTPAAARTPASAVKLGATPAGAGFGSRAHRGDVVGSLNAHLPAAAAAAAAGVAPMDVDGAAGAGAALQPRCSLALLPGGLARGARLLSDRPRDRAAALERRLLALASALEDSGLVPAGAWSPADHAAQQPVVVLGRVCADADGRLLDTALWLEGDRVHSRGQRVRLDLRDVSAPVSLFPGQLIAVRGSNPTGLCLVASRVMPGLPCPLPRWRPAAGTTAGAGAGAGAGLPGALSLLVAAGPYTSSEDWAYEPLAALLAAAAEHRADAVVLAGPFVEWERDGGPALPEDATYADVFRTQVVERIRAWRKTERRAGRRPARVVLVPCARDAHTTPVFPQPPMDLHFDAEEEEEEEEEAQAEEAAGAGAAGAGPGVLAAPNPGCFRLNEVVVGVCAADVLKGLSAVELHRPAPAAGAGAGAATPGAAGGASAAAPMDRLTRLAAHLPAQRGFFPLFPAPAGVPLDTTHWSAAEFAGGMTPDLLICPSDLGPFVKAVPLAAAAGGDGISAGGALPPLADPLPAAAEEDGAAAPMEEEGSAGAAAAAAAAAAMAARRAAALRGAAVVLNPGRLAKGAGGGTYAHVRLAPMTLPAGGEPGDSEAEGGYLHRVDERARIDILRI